MTILLLIALQNDYAAAERPCFARSIAKPCELCADFESIGKLANDAAAQKIAGFLVHKKPREQYHALKLLGATRDEKVVRWLATLLKGKAAAGAAEALGMIKDPIVVDDLIDALKGAAAPQAAWALGRIGDPKAVDPLLDLWKKKGWETRAAVLEALAELKPDAVPPLIPDAIDDKDYRVKMTAAWVAKTDEAGAPATLGTLINDKDWRVRVAAIEGCTDLRSRECVALLINRFGEEDGRLRLDILYALMDLTGKNLGLDPQPWRDWWTVNEKNFEPVARDPKKKGRGQVVDAGAATSSFFEIPILSTRIAFVMDLSGSMKGPYPTKDPNKPTDKLERVKAEMKTTIDGFKPEQCFNILCLGSADDGTYDTNGKVWKKMLVPATPAGKKDAAAFIDGQQAKGWTNIYDALVLAMEDPDVDTIFLLSDGGASRGIFSDITDILDQVAVGNKYRKVHVHTVHFEAPEDGKDFPMRGHVWLLEDLAALTGGTYTQRFPDGN